MKTIDVMEGDRFERIQATVYQYRDGKCRGISDWKVDEWWPDTDTDDEWEITRKSAEQSFQRWGYTITPAANAVVCSKCRTFGCDHHTIPAAKPEAKPADHFGESNEMIPVVDAVWVEDTMADGSKSLTAYSGRESAESCAKLDMERGRARIVRIRTVDEEARADAMELSEWVDGLDQRQDAFEKRLAALEKPADKPAARVVLPKCEHYHAGQYRSGFCDALAAVRTALASQGITIADDNSTQH